MSIIENNINNDVINQATDFDYLRSEGIKLIEKYGSYYWTDYNLHDPGITILDVLVYAITELGYRSNFDIEDLLTNDTGFIKNATFFKPQEILTNAPVTELDWRKILIDINGIANAWWLPKTSKQDSNGQFIPHQQEVPIYYDVLDDALSYNKEDKNNQPLQSLNIKGLNKVVIELDEDIMLGDLNDLFVNLHIKVNNKYIAVKASTNVEHWQHEKAKLFSLMNKPSKITIASKEIINDCVVIHVKRYTQQDQSIIIKLVPIDSRDVKDCYDYFNTEKNVCIVLDHFAKKHAIITRTLNEIATTIENNRNLTEDTVSIEIVKKCDIAICADIAIDPSKDIPKIQAAIWLALNNCINPSIQFYSQQALLNEGKSTQDIFNGPILKNGFLKDAELIKAQLPTAIYASDIIATIMEIDGVIAVSNLLLTAYDHNGIPIQNAMNQKWILPLDGASKAVFNKSISKLQLFNGIIPFMLTDIQLEMAQQYYESNLLSHFNNKNQGNNNSYEPIKGDYLELDTYYSIQNDFPSNYKIGNNVPNKKDNPSTIAASKQLKAYLFFYETLIANFFKQLHDAKNLLDINNNQSTYATSNIDQFAKGLKNGYYNDILKLDLETIYNDQITLEDKQTMFSRKNRVLDHLLARFGESFNNYAHTMYQLSIGKNGMAINEAQLINTKAAYLRDIANLSYARGTGINYCLFKNNNDYSLESLRGGFEKRIARILGLKQIHLQNIVTEPNIQEQWTINLHNDIDHYVFQIIKPEVALEDKWNWCMEHFYDDDNYKIFKSGSKYLIYLYNETKIAKLNRSFDNYDEAHLFLIQMIQNINEYFENFYLLEHMFLRPYSNDSSPSFKLLSTCLNDTCGTLDSSDPYSFKATIIFPGYLQRFKNLAFRKFAEQTIRKEAPAHVLLKICWVGYKDMIQFQRAYKNWIPCYNDFKTANKNGKNVIPKINKLATVQNKLIEALESMNNIYPQGTLYDCKINDFDNPIILGNTALGSTKNN